MLLKNRSNKIKGLFYGFFSLSLFLPFISDAQVKPKTFSALVGNAIDVLNGFIYLTMALATFYFLFGILRYMTQYGNENQRAESAKMISYGLFALFIMVGIWGIIAVLRMSLLGEPGVGIPQF